MTSLLSLDLRRVQTTFQMQEGCSLLIFLKLYVRGARIVQRYSDCLQAGRQRGWRSSSAQGQLYLYLNYMPVLVFKSLRSYCSNYPSYVQIKIVMSG
jgi:hypothetical protein